MPTKRYVIQSRNDIDGFLQGHFSKLYESYLQSTEMCDYGDGEEGKQVNWCYTPFEAMKFDSEDAAWEFARSIWGNHFIEHGMMVVSVFERFDDDRVAEAIQKHQAEEREKELRKFATRNAYAPRVVA